jgi:hypothetical protein
MTTLNRFSWVPSVLALALVGFAIARGEDTRGDVQRIVKDSPCVAQPQGKACRKARIALLMAEPKRISCITFRRLGYPCPLDEAVRQAAKAIERGDAQPPSQGSQQPSPSPPGGGPSPNPPGNPNPPNPPNPPPDGDGPISGVLDEVCRITGPLGVCLD